MPRAWSWGWTMDPMGSVLAMVDTAVSGYLSGAADVAGQRLANRLLGFASRAREGTDEPVPTLPTTPDERRQLAAELHRLASGSTDLGAELARLVEEAEAMARAGRAPLAVPRMLPAVTRHFTDRDLVRARLGALLEAVADAPGGSPVVGAPTVAALVGPGGVGKSATALDCAHRLKDRFPDGQLYAPLRGASAATAVSPADVLTAFLRALDPRGPQPTGGLDELAARFRDTVAGRRLLVLLDDAHSASQVLPLLPAHPEALVLVTSRRRLRGLGMDPGAEIITLGPLEPPHDQLLLARVAGREAEDASALGEVAAHCGGMPLALCETGSLLREREHLSVTTVGRRLAEWTAARPQEGDNREDTMTDRGRPDPVWASTEVSYSELSTDTARLLRLTALWPWPAITPGLAAAMAGLDEEGARAGLEELASVHLLEEFGEERYRFHDAVRRFGAARAEGEESERERARAMRLAVLWVLGRTAERAFRVLPDRWWLGPAFARLSLPADRPREDAALALRALDAERETLWAAVDAAARYGLDEQTWQLAEASWPLHLRLGYHERLVATHAKGAEAAARHAAEAYGDPMAEGRMLVEQAYGYLGLGRFAEAEEALERALAADRRAEHRRGQASALEMRGLLRLRQWRCQEALDLFTEAMAVLRAIRPGEVGAEDVPRAVALLEHNRGRAMRPLRPYPEVVDQLNAALVALREVNDPYNEGRVYTSLGETHLEAGALPDARICLDRAIEKMAAADARPYWIDALELRARVAREDGDAAAERADLTAAEALAARGADHPTVRRLRERLAQLDG
ncbi:ATP-binding protein [Streptomyces triticirhizae]|nr:ATP-binding protein [Streptomyces triticirhizae]